MHYKSLQGRTKPTNNTTNFAVVKKVKQESRKEVEGWRGEYQASCSVMRETAQFSILIYTFTLALGALF